MKSLRASQTKFLSNSSYLIRQTPTGGEPINIPLILDEPLRGLTDISRTALLLEFIHTAAYESFFLHTLIILVRKGFSLKSNATWNFSTFTQQVYPPNANLALPFMVFQELADAVNT